MFKKGSEFPQAYWVMGVAWFVVVIGLGIVFVQEGKEAPLSPPSGAGVWGAGFYLRVIGFLVILGAIGALIWIAWKKANANEEKKK